MHLKQIPILSLHLVLRKLQPLRLNYLFYGPYLSWILISYLLRILWFIFFFKYRVNECVNYICCFFDFVSYLIDSNVKFIYDVVELFLSCNGGFDGFSFNLLDGFGKLDQFCRWMGFGGFGCWEPVLG